MISIDQYYKAIIMEALSIDIESYDLLMANVRDTCKEDGLDFREPEFRSFFVNFVKSGKIIPYTFDQKKKIWCKKKFNPQDLSTYWFAMKSTE